MLGLKQDHVSNDDLWTYGCFLSRVINQTQWKNNKMNDIVMQSLAD